MAQIDGINFSNIEQRRASAAPGVWTNDDNINADGKYEYDGGKSVMALDIDWNGADWQSIPDNQDMPDEINTTADLLKAIKYASEVGGTTEVGAQGAIGATGITVPVLLTALAF